MGGQAVSEQEQNLYQPRMSTELLFSVNGRGDIFIWLSSPDLVLEFHPGDYYYEALLRWCQARGRQGTRKEGKI